MARGSNHKHELVAGPLKKIERAKHHINDLHRKIETFIAGAPFMLMDEIDPKRSERIFVVEAKKAIPDDFSLIIGDAVHNLKSALDLLAYGMVGDRAPKPERVLFPFASTAEGLGGSIANRQIQIAGKNVVAAIHALKPYPGGNDALYGVHLLDLRDKHHLVLTTASVTIFGTETLNALLGGQKFAGEGRIVSTVPIGQPVLSQPLGGNRRERRAMRPSKQQAQVSPTFEICFGQGEGVSGMVVPQLRLMTETVEASIASVADAFFAKE